jgi:hypothetical protein
LKNKSLSENILPPKPDPELSGLVGTGSGGMIHFSSRRHRIVSIFAFVGIPESLRGGVEIKLLGALGAASVFHREFGHQFPVEMPGSQVGCKKRNREKLYIYKIA